MPFASSKISRIKQPRTDRLTKSYTARDLAKRYGFPVVASSPNVWVAIIELGGGHSMADLQSYCQQLGIPVPPIAEISVRGATNSYTGDPNSADGEVALDVQNIVGATMGQVGIILIWSPNDNLGIADGFKAAAADGRASAVSLSWGQNEAGWDRSSMVATDAALEACLAKNMPGFAASGDDGSRDQGSGNNCDYPASSPYCIGCGGTSAPDATTETAWSYGGGGFSAVYAKPAWQSLNVQSQRGVPDVSADADPNTGYTIMLAGKSYVFGGTSAVAPMWAALKALLDASAGKRLSLSNAGLYALNDLTDITVGSNGAFQAMKGWDACTGLGVPNARFVGAVLQGTVTPPPPPPPPPPPTLTKAEMDAFFAQLEKMFASNRQFVYLAEMLRRYADTHWPAGAQEMSLVDMKVSLPPEVIEIIDYAFKAAETAYPQYAVILMAINPLVDMLLGKLQMVIHG